MKIIVHCIAGVSRSASMVIAYFMKHYKLPFKEAFTEVKLKRKIVILLIILDKSKRRVYKTLKKLLRKVTVLNFTNSKQITE